MDFFKFNVQESKIKKKQDKYLNVFEKKLHEKISKKSILKNNFS